MAATNLQTLLGVWEAVNPRIATCILDTDNNTSRSRVQIVDAGAGVDMIECRIVPYRNEGEADGTYETRIGTVPTFQIAKTHIVSIEGNPTP